MSDLHSCAAVHGIRSCSVILSLCACRLSSFNEERQKVPDGDVTGSTGLRCEGCNTNTPQPECIVTVLLRKIPQGRENGCVLDIPGPLNTKAPALPLCTIQSPDGLHAKPHTLAPYHPEMTDSNSS